MPVARRESLVDRIAEYRRSEDWNRAQREWLEAKLAQYDADQQAKSRCKNPHCGRDLTGDVDRRGGARCKPCSAYLTRNGVERPVALIERAAQRNGEA